MHPLLRRFAGLVAADLTAAGFVRRGPVFRHLDADGNGIVVDIQRTTALRGEAECFVNVGLLFAPHLRRSLGSGDPRRDAMPHHGVWQHRLVSTGDTATMPDHRFSLSTEADADRAADIVRTWLAAGLPRLTGLLGDCDAMLAAAEEDRERSDRASAEQLASGRWRPGRWPDGFWLDGVIRVHAYAARGDVDAVAAETADWPNRGPGSLAADALAAAERHRAERPA